MENEEPNKEVPPPESPKDDDSISMLRKQLYAKDESEEIQSRRQEIAKPAPVTKRPLTTPTPKPGLVNVVADRSRKRRKLFRNISIVLLFLIILAGSATATIWYRKTQQVVQDQIHVAISVPESIVAGQTTTYAIEYRNDSNVRWDGVELLIDMPSGMRVTSAPPSARQTGKQQYTLEIGSLEPDQTGNVEIAGQLIGEQGASLLARAQISFAPENVPSGRFDKSESVTTTITSVPIEVSIEAPNNAATGERVPVVIRVRNNGSEVLQGAKLLLEAALGTQLATEDEGFTSGFSVLGSSWDLPSLDPLQEVERTAIVFLDGAPGERRVLTIKGGVHQNDETFTLRAVDQVFTISASELALAQTFNDSSDDLVVRAGQTIKSKIRYQNTGTTPITSGVITVAFEGAALNAAEIDLPSGSYDPTTKTITWRSSSVPGLATILPQQFGEIEYEFGILPIEDFPADDTAKNQNLIVTATIDSPSLPTSGTQRRAISDRSLLPVATDLLLYSDAFYDDGRLGITSTGPLPPKVGETTTYTVRFRFGTTLNDVGDIKMTAVLPDGVRYTDANYKTVGEIDYNERANEIIWEIPYIEGLAGRSKPGPELHIQVAVTPGENLRGEEVSLVQSALVRAVDQFVDESLEVSITKQDLPTSETASEDKGEVE